MNLCLAVFLPGCMIRWWLHIIQLCRVVRDISEPRYPLLCPATSRATQHPPQWVTSIFMRTLGFSAPPLTPQELWGNLDRFISHPAVAHSQVLPFRGALVQPRLSHHLLEKDNRKTHQLSPHNQQTYNFFFSFPWRTNPLPPAPAALLQLAEPQLCTAKCSLADLLPLANSKPSTKAGEFLISQPQHISLWPWTYSKDVPIFQNQNVFIAFYARSDGGSETLALLSRSIFQTFIWD